ncbi:MAG: hypothetical protein H5U40_18145, partial [Polyangiaceae bacterium]|nr:hypothetical protein [Polyangiaceae bacterium]
MSYSDFVRDQARAECAGLFRCTEFVSPLLVESLFATVWGLGDADRCAEVLEDEIVAPAERAAIEAAIEEGRIVFDAAASSACIEAISLDICLLEAFNLAPILAAIDASCAAVLVGTVAESESCFLDEECAPGLTCDTFPGTCGATCKAVDTLEHQVELGGVCDDFDSCV